MLATKCYLPLRDRTSDDPGIREGTAHGPNQRGLSANHIVDACEASLRRLNVDYIDRTHHLAGIGKIIYVAAVPSRRIAMIRP